MRRTNWSEKHGIDGKVTFDIKIWEMLYRKKANWALRLVSEGHFVSFVMARNMAESLFGSKLFRTIRTLSYQKGQDSFERVVRDLQAEEKISQGEACQRLADKVANFIMEQSKGGMDEKSLQHVKQLEEENKKLKKDLEMGKNSSSSSAADKWAQIQEDAVKFLNTLKPKDDSENCLRTFEKTLTQNTLDSYVKKLRSPYFSPFKTGTDLSFLLNTENIVPSKIYI